MGRGSSSAIMRAICVVREPRGAYAVAVVTGPCSAEELRAAGADVVLADLTEFPAWLAAFDEAGAADRAEWSHLHSPVRWSG